MKIAILGAKGHGKDTVAEILARQLGLRYNRTSLIAAQEIIFPWFERHLPSYYPNPTECYYDRNNWRMLWKEIRHRELIAHQDLAYFVKRILSQCDFYIGLRDIDELQECRRQNLFDFEIWVNAKYRKPEIDESLDFTYDADHMLYLSNEVEHLSSLSKQIEHLVVRMSARKSLVDNKKDSPRLIRTQN